MSGKQRVEGKRTVRKRDGGGLKEGYGERWKESQNMVAKIKIVQYALD
jgi:hypothetical protein